MQCKQGLSIFFRSFRIAAPDTSLLSPVKNFTAAEAAPGQGKISLDIPKKGRKSKTDWLTAMAFAVDSKMDHRVPP